MFFLISPSHGCLIVPLIPLLKTAAVSLPLPRAYHEFPKTFTLVIDLNTDKWAGFRTVGEG